MKREILWYPGPHLENSGSISYWSKRVPSMKKNAPQVLPLLIQTHSKPRVFHQNKALCNFKMGGRLQKPDAVFV